MRVLNDVEVMTVSGGADLTAWAPEWVLITARTLPGVALPTPLVHFNFGGLPQGAPIGVPGPVAPSVMGGMPPVPVDDRTGGS